MTRRELSACLDVAEDIVADSCTGPDGKLAVIDHLKASKHSWVIITLSVFCSGSFFGASNAAITIGSQTEVGVNTLKGIGDLRFTALRPLGPSLN